MAYAAEFFRWFSEEAVRIEGGLRGAPCRTAATACCSRRPPRWGPFCSITPWNFPLAMGTRKIGPAVAAGCTMVLKPAPQTPLSSLALAAILKEAGLPGRRAERRHHLPVRGRCARPLLRGGRIRKVSFTGSTGVGRTLVAAVRGPASAAAMELGGNAPFMVFEDADLDAAVDGAMVAKMRNMGEACTAANRFLVHASVAEEFGGGSHARMARWTSARPGRGVDVGR